jgi:hypothetical protein
MPPPASKGRRRRRIPDTTSGGPAAAAAAAAHHRVGSPATEGGGRKVTRQGRRPHSEQERYLCHSKNGVTNSVLDLVVRRRRSSSHDNRNSVTRNSNDRRLSYSS